MHQGQTLKISKLEHDKQCKMNIIAVAVSMINCVQGPRVPGIEIQSTKDFHRRSTKMKSLLKINVTNTIV